GDAVALEQHAGVARVFARDDVGFAQRGQDAQRHVFEVPDRRWVDDQVFCGHAVAASWGNDSSASVGMPFVMLRAISVASIIPVFGLIRAASTRTTSLFGDSARSSIILRVGASSSSFVAIT